MDNENINSNNIQEQNSAAENKIASCLEIFKAAGNLYKSNLGKLFGMMFVPLVGLVPLIVVSIFWLIYSTFLNNESSVFSALNIIFLAFFTVALIIGIAAALIAQAGMLILIRDADKNISIKDAFYKARNIYISLLVINLLIGIFTFIGLVFFILPGIYIFISFSMAPWVLVYEGDRGMSALSRSRNLVKGYWWEIYFRILLVNLFYFLAILIPALVLFKIDFFILIKGIFSQITAFLLFPLYLTASNFIYLSLVNIKSSETSPKRRILIRILIAITSIFLLVIVVGSVGFVAYSGYQIARNQAKNTAIISKIKQIQIALESYYGVFNEYPATLEEIVEKNKYNIPLEDGFGRKFIYKKINKKEYKLCFELFSEFLHYKKGENCISDKIINLNNFNFIENFKAKSKNFIASSSKMDSGIDDLEILTKDSDGDGLSDKEEMYYNTDPNKIDSDNDGYSDLQEILNGYNPLGEGLIAR